MLLNTKKTQLMKLSLSKPKSVDSYHINTDSIQSSHLCNLLGVTIDNQLSFSEHVDDIVARSSFKLYSMRRLKRMGASEKCLLTFYISHILSLITYAAPAWSSLITKGSMEKLEKIQKSSLRIISPDTSYGEHLATLSLPTIHLRLDSNRSEYYRRVINDISHPLNSIISPNRCRRSLRSRRQSYVPVCRTTKFLNSFFIKYSI